MVIPMSAAAFLLVIQESLIIANKHLRFDLFHCLKQYAYDNDQAGASEGNTCAEDSIEEIRQDTYDSQTYGTNKDDVVQNLRQVITGRFSGTDTRDEATLFLHILSYFQRIKGNGCIEVSKEDYQYNVHNQSNGVYRFARFTPVTGIQKS